MKNNLDYCEEKLPKKVLPLNTIYLYFSNYCNLYCKHCWIKPDFVGNDISRTTDIELSYIIEFLKEAKRLGLKNVKITGGEPFIRKDIVELLKWLYYSNLYIRIETNGTFINEQEARIISQTRVTQVSISLDGPNPEVHESLRGVQGSFEKVVEGIKNVKKFCPETHLQVIFCLWRGNKKSLFNTIKFVKKLGANSLKINPIMGVFCEDRLKDNIDLLSVKEIIKIYKEVVNVSDNNSFKIFFDIPPAFKSLDDLKNNKCTCGIKTILGVLGDGTISICGVGRRELELVLGNIKDVDIVDLWKNNKILKVIREDIPKKLEGVCGKCMMKNFCLGKCRAEAYFSNKSLFAPFYFCHKAYEENLFPKSRIL